MNIENFEQEQEDTIINIEYYWEKNKHLVLNNEKCFYFAKRKIGLIKEEKIDYGNKETKSFSEISTFSTCRRKWFWEYRELWTRKVTKNYFFIGGLLHDVMEYLYYLKFYNIDFKLIDLHNIFYFLGNFIIEKAKIEHPNRTVDIELLEFEINKGFAIIDLYFNHALPNDNFVIIPDFEDSSKPFLETIFCNSVETPAGNKSNKFLHVGKIDGLVKIEDSYFLLEHKFLSSFGPSDLEFLHKNLQLLSYVYAIQTKYNIIISGVIYNTIKKPALRMSAGTKKKAPETVEEFRKRIINDMNDRPLHYFNRNIVWFNQEDVNEIPYFIYENCKEMSNPRILPASSFICTRTGCNFKDVCVSDNKEEVLEFNFKRKKQKHEEL